MRDLQPGRRRGLGRRPGAWIKPALRAPILALLILAFAPGLSEAAPQPDDIRRTAILCAYEPEWTALLPFVTEPKEEIRAGMKVVTGMLDGTPVVLVQSGVSMVNATLAAQAVLDRHPVDRIIVMGISGGANPDLRIGDVVIPQQWSEYLETVFARQRDGRYVLPGFYATPQDKHFGMIFPQPVHLKEPDGQAAARSWFPVDLSLLGAARRIPKEVALERCTASHKCLPEAPRLVVGGNGVSGSAFVDNPEFREFVRQVFAAEAIDMEAAAVAHVAFANRVPFLSIRSLSDLAGGEADANQMEAFQDLASVNAVIVLRELLHRLPRSP